LNSRNAGFTADLKRTDRTEPRARAAAPRKWKLASLLAIGAMAAIIGLALMPVQQTTARPTFEGGACSSTYSGCHDGAQTVSMMTVTGLPAGSYVPGQLYSIRVTITDTNGVTGSNSFDMLINAGTLSTSDAEVEINSATGEASANDGADLTLATVFDVSWTAPLSGSATIEIWGVMGDGSGSTHDIWDREVYSYSAIPEFPMILVPIIGIGCAVILASRMTKKK